MDDCYEQNNNDCSFLNTSFMKSKEDNYFEEKVSSLASTNPFNNEYNFENYEYYDNNREFLNNYPDYLFSPFHENEDFEENKENPYLNKNTNKNEDIKPENEISIKDKNTKIFLVDKKLSSKSDLNNQNLKNNTKLKKEENKKDKQYNYGRKKQESGEIGIHTKIFEDNIINKLKANIFNCYIRNLIKKYSINKDIELKKLRTKEFIADLSKFNNERLFNMKISEILREQKISTKYSTFDEFENKKIIDKIYNENIEKNVIKILELTFEELLIIYRISLNASEDMKKLEEIKNKIDGLDLLEEKNKCKGIENLIEELKPNHEDQYIEKVKTVCLGYKNWFNKKKERKYN